MTASDRAASPTPGPSSADAEAGPGAGGAATAATSLGKVLGAARQPVVRAGRELLPVPGAARRPGPHPGPRPVHDQEQLEAFRATYGLDQPLPQQFLTFLKNTLHRRPRDLAALPGAGLRADPRPALADAAAGRHLDDPGDGDRRLPRHHRRLEPRRGRSTRSPPARTLTLYSMPEWWLGLLLIAALRGRRRARSRASSRPAGCTRRTSTRTRSTGVLDTAWHLVLPVITLTLAYLADYSLIMRSLAARRAGGGLPDDGAGQGAARRRRCAAGTPCRNALLPTTTVDRAQPRLRRLGGDHHRDGLLDPRASACSPPRR